MVRMRCSCCETELHQAPASLAGPPDIGGRIRLYHLCRTCFVRVRDRYLALREKSLRLLPIRHGGRPPDRSRTRAA